MKKTLFLTIIIAMVMACKKAATPTVVGYWTGTAVNTGSVDTVPVSLLYRSNNTLRFYFLTVDTAAAAAIEGTYTVGADSIRSTYYISPTATAEFASKMNSAGTQMGGTFRSLVNSSAGIWSVTKH